MLLASTTRAVEFGFHLVAEDDGWGDDEEGREQQGCSIWSEYQPATAQEYVVSLPCLVEPPGLGLQLLRWFIFRLWFHDDLQLLRESGILSQVMA